MLPAPRVFIASRTRAISSFSIGTNDMAISMPSVTARGICTCERLLVIRTGVADIPGTIARNTAPKRFAIDQPASNVPVAA